MVILSLLLASSFIPNQTLRVDLIHTGTATEDIYALASLYRLPFYAGNPEKPLDTTGEGCYQVELRDLPSGVLLYSRGYCTLFGEWQTTEEAKSIKRSFPESFRLPYPAQKVQLVIRKRDRRNIFHELYSLAIDPEDENIAPVFPPEGVKVRKVHNGGEPSASLDIAILCEGYTREEEEKCFKDGAYYGDVLLSSPPFSEYAEHITIQTVFYPSPQRGPSEPLKNYYSGSPAGCTFNTFHSPRYLTTKELQKIQDVTSGVPWDALFVMVNSSRYGGGGIYNQFSIFTSDNEYSEYVFIHEFGHGFAGLGDEYFTKGVSEDFYPDGVEPWEPNLTATLNPLKWKDFVTEDVPIPTPAEEKYAGVVGAFEGAGYKEKGLYRPSLDCKMFSKADVPFCPVCEDAIRRHVELYIQP